MKLPSLNLLALLALSLLGACVHTPPGTSVETALARKPEVISFPAPPVSQVAQTPAQAPGPRRAVEPELPSNNKVEMVADAYTRAQFCMKAGKDAEAIAAFEETVKLDPKFTDAWQSLAMLYEKTGDEKKAMEAFRKSKKVAGR